jgi:hypothetical protein
VLGGCSLRGGEGRIANLTNLRSQLGYPRRVSRDTQQLDPMLDHESITIHPTKIDGRSYPDDYTVIWRGLPIGRVRKNPGLPAHVDQWSWGCNVYGQPSLSGDSGQGTDLEDCKAKFKGAWARVRGRLRDVDIAKAHRMRPEEVRQE